MGSKLLSGLAERAAVLLHTFWASSAVLATRAPSTATLKVPEDHSAAARELQLCCVAQGCHCKFDADEVCRLQALRCSSKAAVASSSLYGKATICGRPGSAIAATPQVTT